MKNRRIIIWLSVGILLLAVANFMLSRNESSKAALVTRTSLLSIPDDEILLLEVSRNGNVECVLTKTGDWHLVEPFSGSADETAVLRLLDAVSCASVNDWIGEKELLKLGRAREDFLLAPPRLSVRFRSDSAETTVAFGALTPSTAEVYAAVDHIPTVFVIPSNTLSAVDVPTSAFRRRNLFPAGDEVVSSFDLKSGGEYLRFRRDGDVWFMTHPTEGPAASTRIKKLLSDVFAARAVDFVWPIGSTNEVKEASSALLAGYGLDAESAVTFAFKGTDGTERRILFGSDAADGLVYALVHNGTAIVTVNRSLKELASLGSVAYADTRLFPYDATQITGLTLSDSGVSCMLAKREDGTWRMDTPIAAEAESSVVESLVTAVLALRSEDVYDDGIEVSVSSGKRNAKVYRSSLGSNFKLEDLRSLNIQNIEPTTVRRIVVTGTDTNKTTAIAFDPVRNSWNVVSSSVQGTVNVAAVEKVLSAVNPLRAARVVKLKVSAGELSTYGLDKPRLTLAIDMVRDDSIRRNILVGERAEGGFYATVGASDAVFVLPYRTYIELSQDLIEE